MGESFQHNDTPIHNQVFERSYPNYSSIFQAAGLEIVGTVLETEVSTPYTVIDE